MNPIDIEQAFREYFVDLTHSTPDGIITIDLPVLHELGLLNCEAPPAKEKKFSQYFHVIESPEKVTLFNDKFIVWIVPRVVDSQPSTYTLIALNNNEKSKLELIYHTKGVYNTPNFVLRILEHFLLEIQENDDILNKISKKI